MRDTTENWQSEFLQLAWQIGCLSILWAVASPQSKSGDERKEQILREILKSVNTDKAEEILNKLDKKYPSK